MRRKLIAMAVLVGGLLAGPSAADARVWFGLPPVVPAPRIGVPPPYYYGGYYAPAPVAVAPPYWRLPYYPYYGYGPYYRGHKWKGRPPGWVKHGRW